MTKGEELQNKLFYTKKNGYTDLKAEEKAKFLTSAKATRRF